MGKPENDVQNACMEYLRLRGITAWRNNTGAVKTGKRYIRYGTPGSGDIFCVVPPMGTFVSIECKVVGKYPTKAQRDWMEQVRSAGGVAFVARSVEDVERALEKEQLR